MTRRIERGAGSAYRLNGRDVRAKDVALLFADAATGAHSPALVSQGKISAVIAAKPTERRLLLEEAAGIAGLHVRRKDAEQKLRATEANLVRLDEILADMELRAFALRRQARAAERYRKLSDSIRIAEARLIFTRWREAADAAEAAKAEAEAADANVAKAAEARLAAAAHQNDAVARLDEARKAAETARRKASELGHALAALKAERDGVRRRIEELEERRRTLAADRGREEALKADAAAAIARLEEELSAIAQRLAEAEQRRGTIDERSVAHEDEARATESALGQARAVQAAEQAEARVAEAALQAARTKLERAEAEAARLAAQMAELGGDADLGAALAGATARRGEAEAALAAAGEKIAKAEATRAEAAAARDSAESEAASARAALSALQSEARALARAAEGGAGDRAINHVRAAPGYEHALAAALGEDLDAGLGSEGPRRWAGAAPEPGDPALPAGCAALADHVEAPAALRRRLAQIAVVERDEGQTLAVGQRLVTKGGRLRRWDGYVATGMGAAAAERLIRVNRLAEIETALPDATAALEAAEDRRSERGDAGRARCRDSGAVEAEASAAVREAVRGGSRRSRSSGCVRRTGLPNASAATDRKGALAEAEAVRSRRRTDGRRRRPSSGGAAEFPKRRPGRERSATSSAEAARKEQADWAPEAEKRSARGGSPRRRRSPQARRGGREFADRRAAEAGEAMEATAAAAAYERGREEALKVTEAKLGEAGEAQASAREARAGATARAEAQEARRTEMARISGEKFECPPPLLPETAGFKEETIADVAAESARLERQ